MQAIQTWLKKWWPTLLPGIMALWATYGTQVQAFISTHPLLSAIVTFGYAIFVHLMPSPVASFVHGPDKGSVAIVAAQSSGKP